MSDCDRTLLMRKRYGNGNGICKDCPHLIRRKYNNVFYKCLAYGDSCSTATDWRVHYIACGLKIKELPEVAMMEIKKHSKREKIEIPMDNQINMMEV